jgi:protein tyrosine/serine phosphatase
MCRWEIENELARSARPGYSGERGAVVSQSEVDAWLSKLKALGIKSIICLLADDQLGFYRELPGGLLSYYREAGFKVEHVPEQDHQSPPLSDANLVAVWNAFQMLPKPILVHCSAGMDRTGRAVEEIQRRLKASA